MEPISQPLPAPLTYSSPVDMVTGGSPAVTMTVTMDSKNGGGGTKMEYTPEQLASLIAASQQQQSQQQQQLGGQPPVITTAAGVNSLQPVVNGATAAMYRQVLQQAGGQAVYPAAQQPPAGILPPPPSGMLPTNGHQGWILMNKIKFCNFEMKKAFLRGLEKTMPLSRNCIELKSLKGLFRAKMNISAFFTY